MNDITDPIVVDVSAQSLSEGDLVFVPGYDRQATVRQVEVVDDLHVAVVFVDDDQLHPIVAVNGAQWSVVTSRGVGLSIEEVEVLDARQRRATQVKAWTDNLRAMADWADEHPDVAPVDLPVFVFAYETHGTPSAFLSALGDEATVDASGDLVRVERQFGPHRIQYAALRTNVCEAVETTKTVTEWVLPEDLAARVETE